MRQGTLLRVNDVARLYVAQGLGGSSNTELGELGLQGRDVVAGDNARSNTPGQGMHGPSTARELVVTRRGSIQRNAVNDVVESTGVFAVAVTDADKPDEVEDWLDEVEETVGAISKKPD